MHCIADMCSVVYHLSGHSHVVTTCSHVIGCAGDSSARYCPSDLASDDMSTGEDGSTMSGSESSNRVHDAEAVLPGDGCQVGYAMHQPDKTCVK